MFQRAYAAYCRRDEDGGGSGGEEAGPGRPLEDCEFGSACRIDYHPGVVELARGFGGRWHPAGQFWSFPTMSPENLQWHLSMALEIDILALDILEGTFDLQGGRFARVPDDDSRLSLLQCAQVDRKPKREDDSPDESRTALLKVDFGRKDAMVHADIQRALDPFADQVRGDQVQCVHHLASQRGAANFGDMGTGKTRSAVLAGHMVRAGSPALVIAPMGLLHGWRLEIHGVLGDGVDISFRQVRQDADWCLISYEDAVALAVEDGAMDGLRFGAGIVDEAHYIKNIASERSVGVFQVMACAEHRYVLTGTPMPNNATELYPLLRLTRHPIAPASEVLGC